jgi:uncharacterized protein YoxC
VILVYIALLIIGVLWILLPFAVFGTKDLIREQLAEQKRTNELLSQLAQHAGRDLPTLTREA